MATHAARQASTQPTAAFQAPGSGTKAASVASHAIANSALATTSVGTGPPKVHQHDEAANPVPKTKRNGHTNPLDVTPTSLPSPATRTPTPTAPLSLNLEPEPAKIISDILPPSSLPPATPAHHALSAPPKPAAASVSARKTKYATDEERRRATSISLRQRWASGAMAHVHKKRLETIRRMKHAETLLGSPGITKPLGPVSNAKHTNKALQDRQPGTKGMAPASTYHAQKRSLVSERLARFFDDSLVSAASMASEKGLEVRNENEQGPAGVPIVRSSDVEMSGLEATQSKLSGALEDKHGDESDGEWEPLEMAAPGRLYSQWKDSSGALIKTRGVLLPESYKLSATTPDYPWICPVRSCRRVFQKMIQLGGHFIRYHRGVLLHDNEDGTLSERGEYAPRSRDKGHAANRTSGPSKPAIIVSRGPADPSDPPPVAPSYPNSTEPTPAINSSSNASIASGGLGPDEQTEPADDGDSLWSYLQPHLVKHKIPEPPESGHRYCTNKAWGADRAKHILNARLEQGDDALFDHTDSSSETEVESNDGAGEHVETHAIDDNNMERVDDDAFTSTTPSTIPASIAEAEPGRPYTMWPDEHGDLVSLFGALLPTGYRLDTTIPNRPWVCPVRTCRKPFRKTQNLGFHFERVHFAALLNDNGDGTFSIKGVYKSKGGNIRGGGKILTKGPPIVISRGPLGRDDDVLAKPQPPIYLGGSALEDGFEEAKAPETEVQAAVGKWGDLWAYIKPFLHDTTELPGSSIVRQLLTLPQRRHLVMKPHFSAKFHEQGSRDIAAMLVQVTGEEASDACSRCKRRNGPFQGVGDSGIIVVFVDPATHVVPDVNRGFARA
ncbi:hypothetical protein MFIFM68171_09789 [Madurella fahalii]|uniref:C2H2-type domain-containing protein n=1 Tax=Madurella fahalii TaxID=1157608 RepID=A0ABQ0GPD1_9PEZI